MLHVTFDARAQNREVWELVTHNRSEFAQRIRIRAEVMPGSELEYSVVLASNR